MNKTIANYTPLEVVYAPPSKSCLHRVLILSALSDNINTIYADEICDDVLCTINCLRALGCDITVFSDRIVVKSNILLHHNDNVTLDCGESGSTLRFLIPIVGALGINAEFVCRGNLITRPMTPLIECLTSNGMSINKSDRGYICSGRLRAGEYKISCEKSSQYVTGLLMALPMLLKESRILTDTDITSAYIELTLECLALWGIKITKTADGFIIPDCQLYKGDENIYPEGDWSAGGVFLCMGALSERGIRVKNLDIASSQPDKAILTILKKFGAEVKITDNELAVKGGGLLGVDINASHFPDLVPLICVLGALSKGQTRIFGVERLRFKESDRISALCSLITDLGGKIEATDNYIRLNGVAEFNNKSIIAVCDHRIAFACALAALKCVNPITIEGAECVKKSFPSFWEKVGI